MAVNNVDIEDVFVTITDNNLNPASFAPGYGGGGKRINHGAADQIQLQEDGSGDCNVTWVATRCNDATVVNTKTQNYTTPETIDVSAR